VISYPSTPTRGRNDAPRESETDVIVIGSGFGGSVAALRFAQAGHSVRVLERGTWVTRDRNQVNLDAFWWPERGRFGPNDLRTRGQTILPWLGACVGGGSHVYAGTLKRDLDFGAFPAAIRDDDLDPYYTVAETMMGVRPYPDYAPYDRVRATQLMLRAGRVLHESYPDEVEEVGPVPLGISFAPASGTAKPSDPFINPHGARQHYSDPREQSLLGGDIGAKNSLDLNYLYLAERAGARIETLVEADRLERVDGRFRVYARRYLPPRTWAERLRNRALLRPVPTELVCFVARRVVVAAGSIGSTELLLRNRDLYKTLPNLGPMLGSRYSTNGNSLSLLLPGRQYVGSWIALLISVIAALVGFATVAVIAFVVHAIALYASKDRAYDPDLGTTNSDFIRLRGRDGKRQGGYIEGGRYPTPGRLVLAVVLSLLGWWRPERYRRLISLTVAVRRFVPPLELLARSWPIPLLQLGRDDAWGRFVLDERGRASIAFDLDANREYYDWIDDWGRKVARSVGMGWAHAPWSRWWRRVEVPHSIGGVPMGESIENGVVDHAGRVFGVDDLFVLDGSILTEPPGPNPALTILALAERAMTHILSAR